MQFINDYIVIVIVNTDGFHTHLLHIKMFGWDSGHSAAAISGVYGLFDMESWIQPFADESHIRPGHHDGGADFRMHIRSAYQSGRNRGIGCDETAEL